MMQDSSKILLRFCLCLVKILQTSTCSRSWQDLGRNLPRSWQDPSKIKILTRSSKIFHDHERSWQGSQPGPVFIPVTKLAVECSQVQGSISESVAPLRLCSFRTWGYFYGWLPVPLLLIKIMIETVKCSLKFLGS